MSVSKYANIVKTILCQNIGCQIFHNLFIAYLRKHVSMS